MAKAKKYYTYTEEHIQIFVSVFNSLVHMFGLSDYSVKFIVVENSKFGAQILYNTAARWANVSINKNMAQKTPHEAAVQRMRKFAAHEFAHLLTADLYRSAIHREYTLTDIDRISEIISKRFEYAVDKLVPPEEDK